MRAVVQRVSSAQVSVEGVVVSEIGRGLLVLVAAHKQDAEHDAVKLADRILGLRIFNDTTGKLNLSLADIQGGEAAILAVSNFTLYGDAGRSRRPSFVEAAPYDRGKELFDLFTHSLESAPRTVATGVFGANMQVALVNDGPVTLIIDVGPSLLD
jgi:D-tyrosyl-tRNA(Tyr) deacylase